MNGQHVTIAMSIMLGNGLAVSRNKHGDYQGIEKSIHGSIPMKKMFHLPIQLIAFRAYLRCYQDLLRSEKSAIQMRLN